MSAWRGVEAQHVVSTMRLVDTADEQELLEALLEASKPPQTSTRRPKHYLLITPFRYTPAHPSRFRPAHSKGQWYGAQELRAACAEVAYWRHRFLLDSAGLANSELLSEHTFFKASVNGLCINLMDHPWVALREKWTDGSDYSATHAVAARAQAQCVQWIRYESVREAGQACAVVFDPESLSEPAVGLDSSKQTWHCRTTRHSVIFRREKEWWSWDF